MSKRLTVEEVQARASAKMAAINEREVLAEMADRTVEAAREMRRGNAGKANEILDEVQRQLTGKVSVGPMNSTPGAPATSKPVST